MRILVSGANGFIGSALVPHLEQQGHTVVRLVRRQQLPTDLTWDPSRGQLDAAAIDGFEIVVHLAGANISGRRWIQTYKQELVNSRVKSTDLLARAIGAASPPPKLFLCMSGVGFYGDCGDRPLTENSACGDDFMAQLCMAWERACEPARRSVRTVNLRTGIVLAASGGALRRMLAPFKLGLGGRLGSGNQYWSWIALDDFLAAVDFIIAHENLSGPVNLVSPNPVTNRQFTEALAQALHRPAIFPAPEFMLRLVFGEMADALFFASQRVVPSVLTEHGFTFGCDRIENVFRNQPEQ